MTTETRSFPLRTVLTVTTGRLLTKPTKNGNGIGDLYEILGWMTDDSPFTHQLGRFADECKPWLFRWFPELVQANDHLHLLDQALKTSGNKRDAISDVIIKEWFDATTKTCGLKPSYDVPRIPSNDHERKHPYDELVAMRGTDEGIIVVEPEESNG